MYMNNMQKKPCNCKNNCMEDKSCKCEKAKDVYSDTCAYVPNMIMKEYDSCECGFDEEDRLFPANPMLAQSYVPWQIMEKTFTPEVGLKMGTIFPELVSPYCPGDSLRQMEYLEATNTIGKGCNR